MKVRKTKRRPNTPQARAPSLKERRDSERQQLFKAMSTIACCRLTTASLHEQGGGREIMTDALQAAYDLIDMTAGELEVIGDEGRAP